jgi:pSer/pThr/pTyr-binding forkhead associated (FHA) protein
MLVGRRSGVDVELADSFVSAEHARLTQEGGRWWVTDLGTTNGTFVNGARIDRPTPLKAGDEVRFARVRARLA